MTILSAPPLQTISHSLWQSQGLRVDMLRLDSIHPEVSGNKFFKLKYNLLAARASGKPRILTFGGAFSNHIYSMASAARLAGIPAMGVIRGEDDPKNPTLRHARSRGMELSFMNRDSYRRKTSPEILDMLENRFGDFYLIPEGGTNGEAIRGASEIFQTLSGATHAGNFSHIALSVGTGGTFAGLARAITSGQTLLGFSSLKGEFIRKEVTQLIEKHDVQVKGRTELHTEFHFGGYAKWTPELVRFIHWFWDEFGIPLDPVYTAKMCFGLVDLIRRGYFPKGSKILVLHTGGIQGSRGFGYRTGIELPFS